MLCALLLALAAPSRAALPAAYAPVSQGWGGAMGAFFASPGAMAEMPKGPLTDFLGGLSLKPAEFGLALAPLVEQLEPFGLEKFSALSEPAKAQALQAALPKAAKAVAAKALALEAAAFEGGLDEKGMREATENLRQLERSFGPFAQAGGYPAARLAEKRGQASWRLAQMMKKSMDVEMRRLWTTLLTETAGAETDAVIADLKEKALTRPMRRDEAVLELLAFLREGDVDRRLAALRALSAIADAMPEREDRLELARELTKALAENKDYRVLTAGHGLLGRLDPARASYEYPTAASGGSQAKQGLSRFSPAKLVARPGKTAIFTDGGDRFAFKVARRGGQGPLIGIKLRAALARMLRVAGLVAASVGVAAGSIFLYAYNPILADAIAALVIIAYLVYQRFATAGSKGGATAGGRTPP